MLIKIRQCILKLLCMYALLLFHIHWNKCVCGCLKINVGKFKRGYLKKKNHFHPQLMNFLSLSSITASHFIQ